MTGTDNMPALRFAMPLPPTENAVDYRQWLRDMRKQFGGVAERSALRDGARCGLMVLLPANVQRGDSGHWVKPICELLQWPTDEFPESIGMFTDDRCVNACYIGRHQGVPSGHCWAYVVPWASWHSFLAYIIQREQGNLI